MARVSQEFYCGECKGYFLVKLNMALNFEVWIVCPNCGHEHRRCVLDGAIRESGRYQTSIKEKIVVSKATYSKIPLTDKMREAHEKSSYGGRRDGSIVRQELYERWLEKGTQYE